MQNAIKYILILKKLIFKSLIILYLIINAVVLTLLPAPMPYVNFVQFPKNLIYKNAFLFCYFGQEIINNSDKVKAFLTSLEQTVPYSTIYIAISTYTRIDNLSFAMYSLNINFERFCNSTKESILKNYKSSNSIRFFFSYLRFEFYKNFFKSHPEIEFAAFFDYDCLILKNPFDLLKTNYDKVHVMYDYQPYSVRSHPNFHWLKSWNRIKLSKRQACGMRKLQKNLQHPDIKKRLPINAGLMIGKVKYLLKICELISSIMNCVAIFKNNNEQGLFNYLVITGQINDLGIKLQCHSVEGGNLISCPNYMSLDNFTRRMNSDEVYVIHHYNWVTQEYVDHCSPRVRKLISFVKLKGK